MASASDDPGIVRGRVDSMGRLVAADPRLAALQVEAGSAVGASLALPQIAAVARLARELEVRIARQAIAAGEHLDYDLWVRATPEGDDVLLEIEGWHARQPAAPQLDLVVPSGDDRSIARDAASERWAVDADLNFTVLAPDLAERLGIDTAAAIGEPLTRLLKLEEQEDGSLPLLSALAARAGFVDQAAIPREGEGVPLMLSAEALSDDSGNFAGFAGRAIPSAPPLQLVPAAASAPPEALDVELDRALRSPVDRIIAVADRIVERTDGPLRSDYADYASDIAAAGRHLLSVIRTMSEGAAAPGRIDLGRCAAEALGLVAAAAETKAISLELQPGSGPLFVQGEARGVVQILVNILGNAIRHSPEATPVTLSLTARGGRVRATIADQGPGIAPADQQRIFERFERLGTEPDGTGLGLAIARRLAQSMDGDISLESTPGDGACFTLELPQA